jgi:hypothetical protein
MNTTFWARCILCDSHESFDSFQLTGHLWRVHGVLPCPYGKSVDEINQHVRDLLHGVQERPPAPSSACLDPPASPPPM